MLRFALRTTPSATAAAAAAAGRRATALTCRALSAAVAHGGDAGGDALEFSVNGERHTVESGSHAVDQSLISYLRVDGATGIKKMCAEGGCGACTAIVSEWDARAGRVVHKSVAACVQPMAALDHKQITTIEGLNQLSPSGVHPIANAFATIGSTQCGYCTPGFISTLAARLAHPTPLLKSELEHVFDGNLCRCTGYRPILDAASVFCEDPIDQEDSRSAQTLGDLPARWRAELAQCRSLDEVFPDDFKSAPRKKLVVGRSEQRWLRARSVDDIVQSWEPNTRGAATNHASMVAGNTDHAFYPTDERPGGLNSRTYVTLDAVDELRDIQWGDDSLTIGAAVTYKELSDELHSKVDQLPQAQQAAVEAILNQCRFLGNTQVRNMGTVGGGVMNFSTYSDMIPIWVAAGAELTFADASGQRVVNLRDQFNADGVLDWDPHTAGLLVSIRVPLHGDNSFLTSFKYSRRRMDSITFLSAGFHAQLDKDRKRIAEATLSFDGLGAPGLRPTNTEEYLRGKEWTEDELQESLRLLREEIEAKNQSKLPQHLRDYQLRLAQGILLRSYRQMRHALHGESPDDDARLVARFPDVAHRSHHHFAHEPEGVLGEPIPNRNGVRQATGQAVYTMDEMRDGMLHAAIVPSPVASGVIKSVDASRALAHPDVVAFVGVEDIPGHNLFGFRRSDEEEVLPTKEVSYVGQPVGAVVAKTVEAARLLAAQVAVEVETQPGQSIVSIDDALEKQATHGNPDGYTLIRGDAAATLADPNFTVVEGTMELPGQNHFYLEPQNALVVPQDDGSYKVQASTQSPTDVVRHISRILGIDEQAVDVRVGAIGGGFGGKQLRAGPIAAVAALAAHKTNKPVHLALSREEDMAWCPGRSRARANYKAAFDKEGHIVGLDVEYLSDGGFSADYSPDIVECVTVLVDSIYHIPNIRSKGVCLRTNLGSNTATRGFGKPQTSAVIETILDHGAIAIDMDPNELRRRNIYQPGQRGITGTEIKDTVPRDCYERVIESANYEQLRAEVDAFNAKSKWVKRGIGVVGSKGNMGFMESDDINRGMAVVTVRPDGVVEVNHSGTEMGQGIDTRMAQVAANCLNVDMDRVIVTDTQTAIIPSTPPTTMSSTDLCGEAIVQATAQINATLGEYDGATFEERVQQALADGKQLTARGAHDAPRLWYDFDKQQGEVSYFFVWGAGLSVAEVDLISGSFRLLKTKIVQDTGKSLNPHLDIGQVEGGFMYGVGYYLLEEMLYNKDGGLISDNVSSYKLPSCGDVPVDWDIELLNYHPSTEDIGIYNSKGVGEANIQLGLSGFFAVQDAVRAARKAAGMSAQINTGFPCSVDRISSCLPSIDAIERQSA